MSCFTHVQLRTTDATAARAFYRAVLGQDLPAIVPLHPQSLARGARPHWLGYLEVDDVDAALAAFLSRGAMALGPKWQNKKGLEAAVVRDPGGAVVALSKLPAHWEGALLEGGGAHDGVKPSWYILNTHRPQAAMANYGELFGFRFAQPLEVPGQGSFYPFSFEADSPVVGALGDIAERPHVHPHWLFYFQVEDLERAQRSVLTEGGSHVASLALPSGTRVTVCEDPQSAAFGLISPAPGSAGSDLSV